MRTVDAVWSELAASGRFRFEAKLEINGVEYTKITAPRISRPAMESPLSVGSCFSSSLKVSILTEDEIASSAAVKVLGRLTNGTAGTVCSGWKSFGTYYISKRSDKAVSGLVTLECYDAMMKANTPYAAASSFTEWPQPQKAVVEEIASLMGVPLDTRTSIKEGEDYVVYLDTTLSQWQVLCYIAGCQGGNFIITEDGALRLVPLVSAAEEVDSAVDVIAVTGDLDIGHPISVDGVEMSDDEGNTYTAGDMDGFVLTVSGNPYATQQICRDLLSTYYGCLYAPFSATKALYDPAAELGDHIKIRDKVSSILYAQELVLDYAFRGDIGSPSSEEVTSEYPYTSPATLEIKREVAKAKSEIKQTTDSIISRVEAVDGKATQIQQTVDGITLEVEEQAGADGQVYARISLQIGPNKYSGLIKMEGNLEVSGQLSADALYARSGDIADLTVNRLSTSRRIIRYLARDMSDDNYVSIHDEQIEFISGVTDGSTVQAQTPDGLPIYWEADISGAEIASNGFPYIDGQRIFTTTAVTDWPVMTYAYTELVKASQHFDMVGEYYLPVFTFGAGDGTGGNIAWLTKEAEALKLLYRTSTGKDLGLIMSNNGYMDAYGLRRTTFMDFSEWSFGKFYESLEGVDREIEYGVQFDDLGRPVKITEGEHVCDIRWGDNL